MEHGGLLFTAFIYLVAGVCAVPIAKRLGLGSVLGYLIAGVLIGPHVLHLVGDQTDVQHFAEFGVVMMLFLVGLELQPARVWQLRGPILGLGGGQVAGTALLLCAAGLALGLPWQTGLAVGLILAMSSTAIVLQSLAEQGVLNSQGGQSAFSVLLFQDIAVIPILALLPLLAVGAGPEAAATAAAHGGANEMAGWQQALLIAASIGGIVVAGRFLMRPAMRFVANSRLPEVFTATALLLVVGVALVMQAVGLSPALGAFLAGVVLAESEYRHELESDIEPFKGLLLGLFFITVGASINLPLLAAQPLRIGLLVLALVVLKFAVLLVLGWLGRMPRGQPLLFAVALAQGGEFAFVLLGFATQSHVLPQDMAALLVLVVALSMVLAPLLMILNARVVQPLLAQAATPGAGAAETEAMPPQAHPVLILGFGRFGQIVGRLLLANGIGVTVLDYDAGQIEVLRKFGYKVFYGDASRLDLLQAAGAAQARLVIVAVDNPDKRLEIIQTLQQHFPRAQIMARATDLVDAYTLVGLGVESIYRETFGSALEMGVDALRRLGMRAYQAVRAGRAFQHHDQSTLRELAALRHDQKQYISRRVQLREELERRLRYDLGDATLTDDRAWDAMPPSDPPPPGPAAPSDVTPLPSAPDRPSKG
jgi:monovalent cation:proton antiporter-2 (CPA2) family protein